MRKYPVQMYINHDIRKLDDLLELVASYSEHVCSQVTIPNSVPQCAISYYAVASVGSNKVQVAFRSRENNNMWVAYFEYSDRWGWTACTNTENCISAYKCRIRDYLEGM